MDNTQNNNTPITLDDLAGMVKHGFDDLSGRMVSMESRLGGRMDSIEKNMATKDDLGKLRSDMIDYIAKQNLELKTDIMIVARGGDRSKDDANRVTRLEPFPQAI